MNILLLQPKFINSEVSFPLGLAYLASSLKASRHKVFALDCAFCDFDRIEDLIKLEKIELIAISSHSYNYKNALHLSRKIKSLFSIPIVFGGPHCTIFPEATIKEPTVDFVIVGGGESIITKLAESLEQNNSLEDIPSLHYKDKKGNVLRNDVPSPTDTLTDLAFPDRTVFPLKSYYGVNSRYQPYAPIITSRGCIHDCKYCPSRKLWKNWRARSTKNIVDEIEEIKKSGINEFHIEDDNFLADHERVGDICSEIIKRKLKIHWQCTNGIYPEDLDPKLLEKMSKSGCYRIALGIESLNKTLLATLNRNLDLGKIKKIINTANQHSIEVVGYFFLGLPGENLGSITHTIHQSKKLKLSFSIFSIFHVIPGSELFESRKDQFDYAKMIQNEISFCEVPIQTLKKLKNYAYFSNLQNPRFYTYLLRSLLSPKNIRNILLKFKQHGLW